MIPSATTLATTLAAALVAIAAADERPPVYVTAVASTLVDQGLAKAVPAGGLGKFEDVPAPALRFRVDDARATRAPWLDSNAWRFQRGVKMARYAKLPAGSAALAAAEAFVFNVDAVLEPDPKDVEPLGQMLKFLKAHQREPMPPMANIDVVDDRSPQMGEILNLLTRRNLLYRVVAKPQPAPRASDLTVQVGSADFPAEAAANPSDFAALVRAKLGDDKRLVRVYGPTAVIAHLTGKGPLVRLFLLSFNANTDRGMQGGDAQGVRVRLHGLYRPTAFAAYGAPAGAELTDIEESGHSFSTEFWVPAFQTIAIIDLDGTLYEVHR